LARLQGTDVDLVVFPAEASPELARELLEVARALPAPPHLVPLGQFTHTETAVAAIEGRTSVVLDRAWTSAEVLARLQDSAARRRQEGRAEARGRLLQARGLRREGRGRQ